MLISIVPPKLYITTNRTHKVIEGANSPANINQVCINTYISTENHELTADISKRSEDSKISILLW